MNNSLAYNPARWLDQFFTDFDKSVHTAYAKNDFTPAVDIVEEKEDYVLRAELPGVAKENIKIEVKENRLTLSGKKESSWSDNGGDANHGQYRYSESRQGAFTRVFELPRNVSGEAIRAEYSNGVLFLRIPKAKEALARTIEIK